MTPETPRLPEDDQEISSAPVQHEADVNSMDKTAPTFFQDQRLHRPRAENPIAEGHRFFGMAETEFSKAKAYDNAGEMDTHSRLGSLHAAYAYLRQSYILFNEDSPGNAGVNGVITNLYKEITDYDLQMSKAKDSDRVQHVSTIDMNDEAEAHLTEQSVMALYDSLLSYPMSVDGFDPSQYEDILGFYLQRYFPFINGLDLHYEDGECQLDIKSSRQLSQSEEKVKENLNNCMTWIGNIGAIHNAALQKNNGEMELETQLELLEYVAQLSNMLHEVHGSTNAHKDRMQRFWTKFVTDPKLAYAPLLHDDGKISVSSKILGKPAGIGSAEMDQVKNHPVGTARFLRNLLGIKNFAQFITLCSSHHMNYALKPASYPDYLPGEKIAQSPETLSDIMRNLTLEEKNTLEELKLSDEDIVLFRLFSLLDILEALTGEREYRDPEAKAKVIRFIRSKAGSLLEPDVASFVFKKLKDGGFDEDLFIAEDDDTDKISDPVFHYGQDILAFLEAEKDELFKDHEIEVDGDIARLKNGLNFPSLKLSGELVRANIYSIFQRRDNTFKLDFESNAEVDEVLMKFLEWTMDNDKTPESANIEYVESAIESFNSGLIRAAS